MTELDKAVAEAKRNKTKEREFNGILLQTFLFILTADPPEPDAETRLTKEGEVFKLIAFEINGKMVSGIFDTLEKLRAWVKNHGTDLTYIQMNGRDFFRYFTDTNITVILNPGTPFLKEFSPQDISDLIAFSEQ